MNSQPAVVAVIDKAQLPEFVHEMTDSRPGRADHLRQALLIMGFVNFVGGVYLALKVHRSFQWIAFAVPLFCGLYVVGVAMQSL